MRHLAARSWLIGLMALVFIGSIAGVASAQFWPGEQQGLLDAHNRLRRSVAEAESARLGRQVVIPDLTWNDEAAAVAKAWADHLLATGTFEHNPNMGPYGENIAYGDGSFDLWAAERAWYDWDTDGCSRVCGHYTQIVWADTTSVGCGRAQAYLVCNYAPPGNFIGTRPYEAGAALEPEPSVAPEPEPSVASVDVATTMLSAHNAIRQAVAAAESGRLGDPVVIPDLAWNPDAAATAQAWAEQLLASGTFQYNPALLQFGENIAWESGLDPATSAQRAVDTWAAERSAYTWDTGSCSASCHQYTQLVWAATTSVGCGTATDGAQVLWVCDYAPAGNIAGQRPYEPSTQHEPAATVAVPDLSGLTLADAAQALANAGLAGATPRVVQDTAPAGMVIGTEPPAGTEVPRGTAVTPILSAGTAAAPSVAPPSAPIATPSVTPSAVPTVPPVSSQASPRAPRPKTFTCVGRTTMADPHRRAWTVNQVFWASRDGYDRVTLRLEPDPGRSGGSSRVVLETLSHEELAAALPGVTAGGDVAVVLRFAGPVSSSGTMTATPGRGSLASVLVTKDARNRPWAVFGVAGDGCTALAVTAWADPSTQTTPFVDITLDIQR